MNRMRVPFLMLSVAVVMCLTGCASYWSDRGRDAADIISLQVGTGAGIKARVGPFQAGLLSENGLVGLRGGEFLGWSQYRAVTTESPAKWDDVILIAGGERFEGSRRLLGRGKAFRARHVILSIPFNVATDRDYLGVSPAPFNPWPYYTEVEAVAGAFLTFRVGANPGELLDFVLGWTTLDIYGDDIGPLHSAVTTDTTNVTTKSTKDTKRGRKGATEN